MATTPEAKVKADIKKCLDKYEGIWYFFPVASRYSVAGTPDIIGCYKGKFFAVEAKATKGTATTLQLRTLERIRQAGGAAEIVKPSSLVSLADQIKTLLGE